MSESCDIAIVGAGAAGMAAGIFAAEVCADRAVTTPRRILLLDGAKTPGAKILVSGGGRCNVTHHVVAPDDYNGSRPIVKNILAAFHATAAVRWMQSLGVELKREPTGKLFPVTDSARTVLAALMKRLDELRVELRSGHRVTDIRLSADGAFEITAQVIGQGEQTLSAAAVILCTGGKSLPRTGSDGQGYSLARRLGHRITPTFAALVPLVLEDGFFHASLSGLSHEAELSTFVERKLVDRRTGSLLWTHFGVSGPVVMDASRFWVMARADGKAVELRCSFFPSEEFSAVEKWLIDLTASRPKVSLRSAISERLPERLCTTLAIHCAVDPARSMGQLSREDRRKIVAALIGLPLPVVHDRGWNYAEVTAGGVPLDEIDFRAMASRKTPGLYLAGEILDCDGRIGGFNFQWAWATGYLAGRAAAKSVPSTNRP